MPIGKNSLKRVTNNGYSSVKTTAPDMENSTVVEEAKPTAEKTAAKKTTATKKTTTAAKKSAPKAEKPEVKEAKPTAKTAEKKPTATKKATTKATEKTAKNAKPTTKATEKKPTAKKTAPKVTATTIPAPAEVVMKVVAPNAPENEKPYCNLGDKLPTYLL